jgi:ABC-type tungstate transport system permease subunit
MKDVARAFKTIKDKAATFISRGDRSGTISPNSCSE